MATKITREVLEAYLHCKTKAHLKLVGQGNGDQSDYESLMAAARRGGEEGSDREDPRPTARS